MKIMFYDEQQKHEFSEEMKNAVVSSVSEAGESEKIEGVINILLTDNEGIRKLNAEFRAIDSLTDVLSFPAYSLEGLLKDNSKNIEWEYQDGEFFLGDIAISLERAYEQAEEYNHSPIREAAFLALHGTLHLLGYDHTDKEDEELMHAKQNQILEKLGIYRD